MSDVCIDALQIEQKLLNVILNAIQGLTNIFSPFFTSEPGTWFRITLPIGLPTEETMLRARSQAPV